MNTHDIEPLKYGGAKSDDYVTGWNDCYAAIEHDRKGRGEPVKGERDSYVEVGSFIWDGDEWRMVAAEYESNQDVVALYRNAPQPAEPMNHPEHPLDMVEPVKYPANKVGFELWAQSHGDLPLDPWDGKANHSWSPATYRHNLTEIAWRAWANKPEATSEPVKVPSDDAIDYEALYDQMCERCDVLDAKLAEYERLADNRDAARYRWIRQHWGRIDDTYYGDTAQFIVPRINDDNEGWDVDPDSLDAAIDVARAQPDNCDAVNIAVFGE